MEKTTTTWSWPTWAIRILATFEDEPALAVEEIAAGNETVRVPRVRDRELLAAYRAAVAIGAVIGTVIS